MKIFSGSVYRKTKVKFCWKIYNIVVVHVITYITDNKKLLLIPFKILKPQNKKITLYHFLRLIFEALMWSSSLKMKPFTQLYTLNSTN